MILLMIQFLYMFINTFQLYSVHSVQKSGQVIPAVFALLPGQSTEWYEVMWTTVFETVSTSDILMDLNKD